jgi:hypothetical protein
MSYTCQRGQGTRGRGGSTGSGVVREDTAVAWCAASEGGMGCRTRPRLAQRVSHKCQYNRIAMGIGRMLDNGEICFVIAQLVEHIRGIADRRRNRFGAKLGELI